MAAELTDWYMLGSEPWRIDGPRGHCLTPRQYESRVLRKELTEKFLGKGKIQKSNTKCWVQ